MTVLYECECGCVNTKDNMISINRPGLLSIKLRCKKHSDTDRGNIVRKFNTCVVCGVKFEVNIAGRPQIKCLACSTQKQKRKQMTINCVKILKQEQITVIPGEVTNFYECGCIVPNKYDVNKVAYFPKNKTRSRTCPFHATPQILIGKYKKCGNCGSEHTGWSVQSSANCKYCPKETKKLRRFSKKLQNNHKADSSRWNCKHRTNCLDKYINYDTIPCKGCSMYTPIPTL